MTPNMEIDVVTSLTARYLREEAEGKKLCGYGSMLNGMDTVVRIELEDGYLHNPCIVSGIEEVPGGYTYTMVHAFRPIVYRNVQPGQFRIMKTFDA